MRVSGYCFGLITTVVLLACGFSATNIASLRGQSKVQPGIDVAEAMNAIYGNYDAGKRVSTTSLPKEKGSFPAPGDQQMIARPFFHAFSTDVGRKAFILVTYAVPTKGSFDCHACAPMIGMAVFSQKGSKWAVEDSNRAVTMSGGWGEPPTDVRLVQVGPDRCAVRITDVGDGQGETTSVLQLLIPWKGTVNLGLERVVSDDDKGGCEPDGGLPCYANHRTVSFIRNDHLDYYDLQLKLVGTDLPVSEAHVSMQARKVSGLETLEFVGGRYVQVSRVGDLTTVDRAVAKREGLK